MPYSTISSVLRDLCRPGYNITVVREGVFSNAENSPDAYEQGSSIICVVSYQQAQDFLSGKSTRWSLVPCFASTWNTTLEEVSHHGLVLEAI